MLEKIIKKIFNKKEEEIQKIEKENNEDEDNFEIEFEEEPIKNIEKYVKQNEKKYKPKKEKPHYWTEHIDTSKLNKNENTKEDIIDAEIIKENKKKKNFYQLQKEWAKKGKEYEKFIGKHYENLGYIVKFNGIENGKKDNSIDLIAIKQNELIFIQCKNWKENSKYKINHKDIKAFIGDTHIFIKENQQYKNYQIKRHFVISNRILDKSAVNYIKEHRNEIEYKLIEFKK
jgi:restriction system protein